MRHLRSTSEIGDLTTITLHWWQLVSGLSTPLLENTSPTILYTGHHWFTSLRQFLHNLNGNIIIPNLRNSIPPLLQVNDRAIMDTVSISDFTSIEKESFNRVRLWMGVHSITEITSADGSKLSVNAWRGTRQPHTATLWPIQPKPGQQSFHDWRKLLSKTFLKHKSQKPNIHSSDRTLQTTLEEWKHQSSWFRKKLKSFYSKTNKSLVIINDDDSTIQSYPRMRNSRWRSNKKSSRAQMFYTLPAIIHHIPEDCMPVDYDRQQSFMSSSGYSTKETL